MFVKQEKAPYTQITITLETENEAKVLWHLLRCGSLAFFHEHAQAVGLDYYATKNHMFSTLNRVFKPE
jgi:hypothetical protein